MSYVGQTPDDKINLYFRCNHGGQMYYDVHESNAGQTPGAYLEFGAHTHDG